MGSVRGAGKGYRWWSEGMRVQGAFIERFSCS